MSREGGGQLRDIVNKDGPMSGSKTKSIDQGKSSEKTDKASKVLELGDNYELVDLKNEQMNEIRQEILMGRERLFRRKVNDRSPDDNKSKSSKQRSKASKKANFGGTGASGGFASINESQIQIDGISTENQATYFANNIIDRSSTLNFKKVKKRDFTLPKCKILKSLGAEYYDASQNIDQLALHVKQTMAQSKILWKELDNELLYHMIKKCMIDELFRIEERKHVRRTQEEIMRKAQEKKE